MYRVMSEVLFSNDQLTTSLPNLELLKTDHMLRAVVWVVKILNFLVYDWTVKGEWYDPIMHNILKVPKSVISVFVCKLLIFHPIDIKKNPIVPYNMNKILFTDIPALAWFWWFFSSPGPKVQVNYCHHLASVVCRL